MSDVGTCTCDPQAYEAGPEGQRRYFEDRYCPLHGETAEAIRALPAGYAIWTYGRYDADGLDQMVFAKELPDA